MISKNYVECVIGIDGGGTKTTAALANLKGKILALAKSGSSSPRNVGIKKTAKSVAIAIRGVLKKVDKDAKILAVFVGLPTVQEEFRSKKGKIKKEILKQKGISQISKGKIIIDSDQITAFRSGTDEKDGVLVIAGTGCVAHGWRQGKETHTSGCGWLADEGSAFWVGQKAFQLVLKALDGRGSKTLITDLVFKKLKIKDENELLIKVYSKNPTEIIPILSALTDEASKKGDKVAKAIMVEAGKELSLSANTAIKKLNLQKTKFPLVLVGGTFKSKIVFEEFSKGVKEFAPRASLILPTGNPVIGTVKLAIESLKRIP